MPVRGSRRAVGLASEGRGEAAAPQRRDPRVNHGRLRPVTLAALPSRLPAAVLAAYGRGRQAPARRRCALDTVIVTHWDTDHYGGASRLAVALTANKVLYNHDTLFVSDDSPGHRIKSTLKNFFNIPMGQEVLESAAAGKEGTIGNVAWRILAPTHYELTKAYVSGRRNVASAVVEVRVPALKILIGGDAVGATWDRLLIEGSLKSDVLRWPHHGADLAGDRDGSIRDRVLATVDPALVIISTGATNLYGHPSELIARVAAARSSVMCTQVTAGCFGFFSKASRETTAAQTLMNGHREEPCAGTISIDCWDTTYQMSPSPSQHAIRVGMWPHSMCLKAAVTS